MALSVPSHRQAWKSGGFPADRQPVFPHNAVGRAVAVTAQDRRGRGQYIAFGNQDASRTCIQIRFIMSPSTSNRESRATIAGFEAMLWLKKGFGFIGAWTITDQNDRLARLFGLQKVTK